MAEDARGHLGSRRGRERRRRLAFGEATLAHEVSAVVRFRIGNMLNQKREAASDLIAASGDAGRAAARLGVTLDGHARELVVHVDLIMRQLVFAEDRPVADQLFSRHEIGVTDTLGGVGPMTMGELARRLRLPLSTATRVVDGLVARGLVLRERPEDNRRVVRVALTENGSALYREALAARVTAFRAMLKVLRLEERRELIRLFRKISAAVASEPAR